MLNATVMPTFTLIPFSPSVTAGLEVVVSIWLTFYCAFSEEAVIEDLGWVKSSVSPPQSILLMKTLYLTGAGLAFIASHFRCDSTLFLNWS